ncbi:MAG: 5-oxoprolinase subunit PxpA [Flavobacteriaceae bacterium]
MKDLVIDINCDVGEGAGNEPDIFPIISSCSIACGGHAGNKESISTIIRLAKEHIVKIGAHPSYPDKENFGRKSMDLPPAEFIESIRGQMTLFSEVLQTEGATMHHIKAHGALYNDLCVNRSLSQNFILAIEPFIQNVKLYAPYSSVLADVALLKNIEVVYEAFADRNYNADLSLVSRSEPNAIIDNPAEVLKHLAQIAKKGAVHTIKGIDVPIIAKTFCVHSDTPSALQILTYLAAQLPGRHIIIAK